MARDTGPTGRDDSGREDPGRDGADDTGGLRPDDSGRHHRADRSDDARIAYLAGDTDQLLDTAERAELDELRSLLADPNLWAEPPAVLEDLVVSAISAEAGQRTEQGPGSGPAAAAGMSAVPPTGGGPETAQRPETAVPPSATGGPPRETGPAAAPPAPPAPIDLAAARETRARRRRFTRPSILLAAAALIVVGAVTAVLVLRPPSQPRFEAALTGTELAPGASGTAEMVRTDSGWDIRLNATGLPRLDGGTFYQAWLRNAEGILVPIGTFNEGTDVILWAGVSPERFPTFTITRETADGDQNSSGQRVLVGTAVPG